MTERISDALQRGAARLAAAGIESPAREARLLLLHALGAPFGTLPDPDAEMPEAYDSLIARRAAREPFARIVGRQGFWSLDLAVSPATLIPRADSEAVIESLLAAFPRSALPRRILDLGTGTGALLLAALAECPDAVGIGVDLSVAAVATAAANARAAGLGDRAMFCVGHWGDALAGQFDAVLANPPYIPSGDIARLMPEVARHEPLLALDGGDDGLAAYRRIIPDLLRLLRPHGIAVLEIGADQADRVTALATAKGLCVCDMRRDLGGIARAVTLGWAGG